MYRTAKHHCEDKQEITAVTSSVIPRLPRFMSNPLTTTIAQTSQQSFVVGFYAKRSENTA